MKRSVVVGITLGATAAAIAVGVGVAVWSSTRSPSPSEVAVAYFAALEAGDADAALALTDAADAEADDLITAYAAVEERVAEARVIEATEQSDSARLVVAFEIDGEPHESELALVRASGEDWIITDGTGSLVASTTIGDAAGVGALVVTADRATSLLPGRYEVQPLPRGLVTGSATTVVTPGSESLVTLEASLTPEATVSAQAQLDAYAAECTRSGSTVPPNCGLRVPWAADLASLTSIAYRVDRLPVLVISPDARTFAATGGVVVATATGTTRDGGTGSFTYRADDWALRGTVTFSGNEMVLAVG